MQKQELAIMEAPLAPSCEVLEYALEELDGLTRIPFGKIKIPPAGGSAFEVYELAEEESHAETEIRGVIIHHNALNAYWGAKFSGDNAPPDCRSADGKTGVVAVTGEVRDCATCRLNEFGSAKDDLGTPMRSKACRNMHVLYILREGADDIVPMTMTLPPSSLPAFNNYRAKVVLGMREGRLINMVTGITLKKDKNKDGITVSKAVFRPLGAVPTDARQGLQEYADTIRRIAAKVQESAAAYDAVPDEGRTIPRVEPRPEAYVVDEPLPFDLP